MQGKGGKRRRFTPCTVQYVFFRRIEIFYVQMRARVGPPHGVGRAKFFFTSRTRAIRWTFPDHKNTTGCRPVARYDRYFISYLCAPCVSCVIVMAYFQAESSFKKMRSNFNAGIVPSPAQVAKYRTGCPARGTNVGGVCKNNGKRANETALSKKRKRARRDGSLILPNLRMKRE